jgi:DNA-binding response OmpR family regulator
MSTVLVADDEERVVAVLARSLVNEGHSVTTARDGLEALEKLVGHAVDLVLLDLVMPRCNGLQVLRSMRERGDGRPVIMLSAVNEVAARVEALDAGAADYINKPFHTAELVARVRRHLTSAPRPADQSERYLSAGGIVLDLDRRRAHVDGRDEVLSGREFALLAHLMRRRGSVCRRDELLHDIWGMDFDPGSNVVDVCVRRLRSRLDPAPIETVRGVGYCFYGA